MSMRIFVCAKHVPDTAAVIRIVGDDGIDPDVLFAMNPYDEYALEEALRLREQVGGGAEVILLTLGPEAAANTVRAGLAMGADRAVHVQQETSWLDGRRTARVLARAIEQAGPPDLILTGMKAVDHEGMQTPYRLAAHFNLPVVTQAACLAYREGKVTVHCEGEAGAQEVYELACPCVIGATKGANEPRLPKLPDIMKAKRKEVSRITEESLGLEPSPEATALVKLSLPPEKPPVQILSGPAEVAARELVDRLAVDHGIW